MVQVPFSVPFWVTPLSPSLSRNSQLSPLELGSISFTFPPYPGVLPTSFLELVSGTQMFEAFLSWNSQLSSMELSCGLASCGGFTTFSPSWPLFLNWAPYQSSLSLLLFPAVRKEEVFMLVFFSQLIPDWLAERQVLPYPLYKAPSPKLFKKQ